MGVVLLPRPLLLFGLGLGLGSETNMGGGQVMGKCTNLLTLHRSVESDGVFPACLVIC